MELLYYHPTILLAVTFVICLLIRVPIAVSLGVASIAALHFSYYSLSTVPHDMFSSLDNVVLMAIPGFVYAGTIMGRGGISYYLIEAMKAWVGHTHGGLSVVTILSCMIFAAISGSSPATAAAIGAIMIPGMVDAGYGKNYAMGLVAASGTLGILIPPSIPLILYGAISEESVAKLFMASMIPGIMMGGILIAAAIVYAKIKGHGGLEKQGWVERKQKTKKAIWGLLLPVIILGGIYAGVVTPTEASMVAVVYALFVSILVYREMDFKLFVEVTRQAVNISAMIFLIIAGALIFAKFLTIQQIPQDFSNWIADVSPNKWVFLIGANLMFIIMGMFMEAVAIILITLPILLPALQIFGVDVIHFAVIMTVNMELAMITPPVGLNLFVVSGVGEEDVTRVFKGVAPFFLLLLLGLVIIMVFPPLSLSILGR